MFRNLLHHHVHQRSEDVDLGMRLSADGYRIVLHAEIQRKRLKHWSLWEMVRTDFVGRWHSLGRAPAAPSHSTKVLNLGWRHRLSALAAAIGVVALVGESLRTNARAFGQATVRHALFGLLLGRLTR